MNYFTIKKKSLIVGTIFIILLLALCLINVKSKWGEYYKKTLKLPPNDLLIKNFSLVNNKSKTKLALDLGCGAGNETAFLLNKGWKVVAMDSEPLAIKTLSQREDIQKTITNLQTKISKFENLNWNEVPAIDLVVASYSLPFCKSSDFSYVWSQLYKKIAPGGFFIGEFFGNEYTGFSQKDRKNMLFLTKSEVLNLFKNFNIIYFNELKEHSLTRTGKAVNSHIFEVVAEKRNS